MPDMKTTKCPNINCRKDFICGLMNGLDKCWCMEVPPKYAVQSGQCRCEDCFKKSIQLPD